MSLLAITQAKKSFGALEVLRGVSLSVDTGQVVCLIGPSGSGKSTLLRCVNLLVPLDGGELRFSGVTIHGHLRSRDLRRVRSQMGFVFQSFNLFPHLTAVQNICLAPKLVLGEKSAVVRERALELLAKIRLDDKADAYPDELSGGQQQRVAIARALAMRPKLLLLDEITSALDPELVGEVLVIIEELAREGMTMLVVTHEMLFAKRVADRVVVLDRGVVIESGSPQTVFGNPENPRTREFLARVLSEHGPAR